MVKIILFMCMITAFLWVVVRVKYAFSSSCLRYKYWLQDDVVGALYLLCKYATLCTVGGTLVWFFANWWFA